MAMAPSLTATTDGAWLTWLQPTEDAGVLELRAAFRGHGVDTKWTSPMTITRRSNFFANWADVPRLGVGGDGSLYATWLQTSGPGTYAYDIGIARSTDGTTWSMLGTLNDDRVLGEHGFVSLLPEGDGVRAFWLDGRAISGEGHAGHGAGDMTLRTALVDTKVGSSTVLDERVCECCPTSAAALPLGPGIVVRDRGPLEQRDIGILRNVEGRWTRPALVSKDDWHIAGCPVNGPRLVAADGHAAVAWYSGGGERPGLQLAWSTDGGGTFAPPQEIANAEAIGRPALALVDDGAMIGWIDVLGDTQVLLVRHVAFDGTLGPVEQLATLPDGRAAGTPEMARLGKHVLVTWTALKGSKKGLEALLLPMDTFPRG
jgi:hypothetical protein